MPSPARGAELKKGFSLPLAAQHDAARDGSRRQRPRFPLRAERAPQIQPRHRPSKRPSQCRRRRQRQTTSRRAVLLLLRPRATHRRAGDTPLCVNGRSI